MFGSGKIQSLEAQIRELNSQLEQARKEKSALEQKLEGAREQAAQLEARLADTDLDALKEETRATKAEYEGLKELYAKKIQAFDAAKEEKEQDFAREAALARHNLENEIRDNRQANRDYVRSTVKTFSDSYNYYLDQIKILMDALGNAAAQTGEMLFMASNEDLKTKFGQQVAYKLQSDKETLRSDTGDLILIGSAEQGKTALDEEELPADLPVEAPCEETESEPEPETEAEPEAEADAEPEPEPAADLAEDVSAEDADEGENLEEV